MSDTDPFSIYGAKSWGVQCRCATCKHTVTKASPELVERFGPDCTAEQLAPHLVCSQCGSKDVRAYTVSIGIGPDQFPR